MTMHMKAMIAAAVVGLGSAPALAAQSASGTPVPSKSGAPHMRSGSQGSVHVANMAALVRGKSRHS